MKKQARGRARNHLLLRVAAGAFAIGSMAVAPPAMAQGTSAQFRIPAQPLADALLQISRQGGVDVTAPETLTRGRTAPAISGQMTPREALSRALAGSGLRFRAAGRNGFVIEGSPAPGEGQADGTPAEDEGAEIRVTGTRIRGQDPVGSPISRYSRSDIERTGAANVEQFLSTVPQTYGGGRSQDVNAYATTESGDNNTYGSSVDLRGLGLGSTLVLVDGRRVSLSGQAEYVDVSMIPVSAIERIDILTDGASAIYGSDAVAGVVNIITRRDYRGAQTIFRIGGTTRGGGEEMLASQSYGAGWGSGNLLLSYEYYDRNQITSGQRDLANRPPRNPLEPGQQRHSGRASIRQNLSPDISAFGTLAYSHRDTRYGIFDTNDVRIAANVDQFDGSAGINATLLRGWTAEIVGSTSRTYNLSTTNILDLDQTSRSSFEYTIDGVEGSISGALFETPSGPVRFAAGGAFRTESLQSRFGDATTFTAISGRQRSNVGSIYAEAVAPLFGRTPGGLPRLQLSAAGRFDHYSQFGGSINPKLGFAWNMSDHLRLRGSFGTSFRAPTLQQSDVRNNNIALSNRPNTRFGGTARFIALQGSDPDLGPETATTWTAGLDLDLRSSIGFSAQVTYFSNSYRNRIASISAAQILQIYDDPYTGTRIRRGEVSETEFNTRAAEILSNPEGLLLFGCNRGSQIAGPCSEPVGNFLAILDRRLRNLSATKDQGIDVALQQHVETSIGIFDLSLSGSYLFQLEKQLTATAPTIDVVDTYLNPVDLRIRLVGIWRRAGWEVSASASYYDSYVNNVVSPVARIDSWTIADLNIRYDLGHASPALAGSSITLNVTNVFDNVPPFVVDPIGINYDPANANAVGRTVSLQFRRDW